MTDRIRVIVPTSRLIVRVPGAQGIQGAPAEAAPVTSVAGRTGAIVLTKNDVGLDHIDNTSDANKPVSTAQAAADAAVAAAASAYTDAQILAALVSAIKSRGGLNCSASPNYPAATANDLYYVTHAGKIGGVAGPAVEIGDTLICVSTAVAGDHATVGASWVIVQANMPGLTTVGTNLATLATPAGPRFLRVNADGTVSVLSDADFKTAMALAKADVGLSAVDNTADADKPVSSAQATALAGKAAVSLVGSPVEISFYASDLSTAITAGTGKVFLRMPFAMNLTAVRGALATAQASGSIFTVDINQGGVSVLGTKLTIDNTEKTSVTAATAATIATADLTDDAEISVDVDQIGDGTAKGLFITLIGTRA